MKPTIFIGSSGERADVARALEVNLADFAEVNMWTRSFSPGRTVFDELIEISHSFDFAVIVITPDDETISREQKFLSPRDNVIFELGMFLGSIGPKRVFALMQEGAKTKIMSDFSGVTYLTYNAFRADRDLIKALSPASTIIRGCINKFGKINNNSDTLNYLFPGELIGLEKIYENFEAARRYIYEDLKSTPGPIRIFIHIASQDIGLKGSFFDVLDEVVHKGNVDVRVLHATHESPQFSRDRLISLGKDYSRVIKSLEYANLSLRTLEEIESSSLRRRSHKLPFIWRLYFVFDRLYMMPYFSDKDAVKSSPVLVFTRNGRSLYHVFKEWFDNAWEVSLPERVELTDIVSPAAPAGSALFLKWEGMHVFGIPMRDLKRKTGRVRFYGIGGKRTSSTESFEDCALREGNEELSGSVAGLQDSNTTSYVRNDGTNRLISVSGSEFVPRLILEKADHSGLGAMPINADDYFLIGFDAMLKCAPKPSRELAAVLLLSDDCLKIFITNPAVSVFEILKMGGRVITQDGINIDDETVLTPHGTASFMIRNMLI